MQLPDGVTRQDIVRRLVGAYLAGADEIGVRGRGRLDPEVRRVVRETARDLVGVEILEESSDYITLQDLVGISEMDLRKTVTRMHRIARIMLDDALEAVRNNDNALAQDVRSRDDEVDRLEWMVSKQMHALLDQPRLAARLQTRPAEALNMFLVARTLERMSDHASKICLNLLELEHTAPPNVLNAIMEQAAKVQHVWDEAFGALKAVDFERGSAAVDEGKAAAPWRAGFTHELRHLDPVIVGPLSLIADSVDRVRAYAIDIAEIALNHTFQVA
jgi:phosphate uptake regulator